MDHRRRAATTGTALVILAMLVAGCAPSGSASPRASPSPALTSTEESAIASSAPAGSPAATSRASSEPAATTLPTIAPPTLDQAWANVELTNVADGSTFRIADFAGRTVFLENMAIWCSKCRDQQREAAKAAQALGDDVAFIVLDVEPTEDAAGLAAYAARNDFPFIYAVAPRAYGRAISREFGDLVLAPPTTPVWFIGADGTVTFTESGIKSADELVELARAHGAS
jgi:thiol-disulfide isomerase/thioredoxin